MVSHAKPRPEEKLPQDSYERSHQIPFSETTLFYGRVATIYLRLRVALVSMATAMSAFGLIIFGCSCLKLALKRRCLYGLLTCRESRVPDIDLRASSGGDRGDL